MGLLSNPLYNWNLTLISKFFKVTRGWFVLHFCNVLSNVLCYYLLVNFVSKTDYLKLYIQGVPEIVECSSSILRFTINQSTSPNL